MAYEPVAVRADGTNDWLSRSSGAGLSNSTDFTIRFAFKRNGDPATAENFCCLPSSRFILSINTVGRLQLIGRSNGSTINLNVLSPSGTSWADNSWHEVIITRAGTGTPLLSIDAAMHTMAVATNLGTALEFSGDAAGWGVLSTQVGGGKFTGDISDFWFKAGAGFSLAAGENDFHDASGKLKDLGSSGVAEGMTPDIWLHRAVASWHTNDGAIGGFTLNGALEAAPDAPLGAETGATGVAVAALQPLAASAAGELIYVGSAAGALQHAIAAASGRAEAQGTAAAAMQNLVAAAAGQHVAYLGSAAAALQHLEASAAGELIYLGSGAGALQHLVAAAVGRAEAQGSAATALQHLVAAATGQSIGYVGAAAGALQHLIAAATGRAEAQGASAAVLQALVADADGAFTANTPTGTAAAALQHLAAAAAGLERFDGSAAGALQHLTAAAVGRAEAQGAAAAALQHLIAAAAGLRVIEEVSGIAACTVTSRQEPWDDGTFWDDGTGWYEEGLLAEASAIFAQGAFSSAAAALQSLEASALAELVPAGNAAAVLEILQAAASGDAEAQGTAAVELQHLIAVASGLCVSGQGSFLQQWRRLTLDTRMGM